MTSLCLNAANVIAANTAPSMAPSTARGTVPDQPPPSVAIAQPRPQTVITRTPVEFRWDAYRPPADQVARAQYWIEKRHCPQQVIIGTRRGTSDLGTYYPKCLASGPAVWNDHFMKVLRLPQKGTIWVRLMTKFSWFYAGRTWEDVETWTDHSYTTKIAFLPDTIKETISDALNEDIKEIGNEATIMRVTRASINSPGEEGNDWSQAPAISKDGRFVVFESQASNLVDGTNNGYWNIYRHDRHLQQTTRISTNRFGTAGGDGDSHWPTISADGCYISFWSPATDLIDHDTNGSNADIFLYDCHAVSQPLSLVSVSSQGSPGNNHSFRPGISADGRYVAFRSEANNLVEDDTNQTDDIFVHDRVTRETTRVSIPSDGEEANGYSRRASISADGRFIAFESFAFNLVDGDTNEKSDIFVHDRQDHITTRVSLTNNDEEVFLGWNSSPSISGDGKVVVFISNADYKIPGVPRYPRIYHVYARFLDTGITQLASKAFIETFNFTNIGNQSSGSPSISSDGRFVTYSTRASNLMWLVHDLTWTDDNQASDVFVHDLQTQRTRLISDTPEGFVGNGSSAGRPAISGNGRVIAFTSQAEDLASGDTNEVADIFIHETPQLEHYFQTNF